MIFEFSVRGAGRAGGRQAVACGRQLCADAATEELETFIFRSGAESGL